MKQTPARARPVRVQDEPLTRRQIVSRIILGVIALALLAGMVVQFTPNIGKGQTANKGTTVFTVNGVPVTDRDLALLKERTPSFKLGLGGVVGQDIDNLVVDQQVLLTAVNQDSSRIRVSGGDVKATIDQIRASNNLQRNEDYLAALNRLGYTDASFREEVRKSIQIQKRIEELQKGTKVSDEQARFYYELNKANYKNDPRIVARQIVLNDRKTADEVKAKADKGEDFAALAKQYSKTGADQQGALGAKTGETTPQPITRIALPTSVADAAFKLSSGGITDVVPEGGKFYIVKVEKALPGGEQSFDEAKSKVESEALQAAQGQAVEAWVEGLRKNAKVVFEKNSSIKFYNPDVAKVEDRSIKLADLNRTVYLNDQITQFLQSGGEQGSSLILQLFKPQALDNLINQEVALKAAKKTGKPFVGDRNTVLSEVQAYAARDVKVGDADARKYYESNVDAYTTPASATVTQASFTTADAAKKFRASFVAAPKDFSKAVGTAKGTVTELGSVTAGTLDAAFSKAVFESKALTAAGDGQVTDVLEKDKKFNVLYVTNLTDKKVQTFEQAKSDATDKALAAKKAEAGQQWLQTQRKGMKISNYLDKVNKELEAKAAAAAPKTTTPTTGSGSKGSGTTGSGSTGSGTTNGKTQGPPPANK